MNNRATTAISPQNVDNVGLAAFSTCASPEDSRLFTRLAWVAVAVGCLFRIFGYLLNRSLWLDEAYLALNILHRSYAGLLRPLENHQGAPIGFLLLEKFAVRSLGANEYALRLLPLVAGLIALLLFCQTARLALRPGAAAVATALFAVSPSLLYYSSEVKQYSGDVALAVLLYLVALGAPIADWTLARIAALGLIGGAAIWFSHPSVFVLAGIGVTVLGACVARGHWSTLLRFCLAGLLWTASALAAYFFVLRSLTRDPALFQYWAENFMPLPPRSLSDWKWLVDSFFAFFSQTAGWEFAGLAALAFVLGFAGLWRTRRETLFLLLAPALLTLFASGLHKYPFGGRLTLFLVPAVLLVMGEGVEQLRLATRGHAAVIGYAFIILLLLDPTVYVLHHFAKPHILIKHSGVMAPEEIKAVRTYVFNHQQPGDLIYLNTGSEPAWQFYDEVEGRAEPNLVYGTAAGDKVSDYASDLDRLRGRRVWVILSHIGGGGARQAAYIEFYLDADGRRTDRFTAPGAEADLYDLRLSAPAVQP
ncbi:MAG TPA: hypothetical protein VKT29_05390 [Terriglobales bacterium]|nr:hypothetical protein [Terriglobales bacterium]